CRQQPVQQRRRGEPQRQRADAAADRDLALARAAQPAQFGDARLALFGAGVVRQRVEAVAAVAAVALAPVHRLAPILMCRVKGESGWSTPRAMSSRTGPTGERQRRPMPTPVRMSGFLPSKALPLPTNTAAPHGPPLK